MRSDYVKKIAISGLMAALAVVIMCFGGMIPVATYVTPVMCTLIGNVVFKLCGQKLAWTWYVAVCLLSLLLSPDKEAAAVYTFLGIYPCMKPFIDKFKLHILLKFLYFNLIALSAYHLLLQLLGLTDVLDDYAQMGAVGALVVLVLGNITFFMLDILLGRSFKRR